MEKNKKVIRIALFSLIPALCEYFSQADGLIVWMQNKDYIGGNVNLTILQNVIGILSIIFTFVLLSVPYAKSEIERKQSELQRDMLLKSNKEIFEATLKKTLGIEHCRLNIRIFVPKVTCLHKICQRLSINRKLEYHIKNIEGLAENDITKDLKFIVSPNKQGLVGECYERRGVVYDDDLENSNETSYNLTGYQIAKTNNLKFILACPIFSEAGDIISIVSFDSCDEIKLCEDNKDKLRNMVLNYTQTLYECIPGLFRIKGGIL